MEAMRFRVGTSPDASRADIKIEKPSELTHNPPGVFHTAYVLEPLTTDELSHLVELLDYHALAVLYESRGAPRGDAET
jgi:hypothetical protein